MLSQPGCRTFINRGLVPFYCCLLCYIWPVWLLLQQKCYYPFHLQVHLYNIMHCCIITFSFYRSKGWPLLGLIVRMSFGMNYKHCNFSVAFTFLWRDWYTLFWKLLHSYRNYHFHLLITVYLQRLFILTSVTCKFISWFWTTLER